MPAQANLPSRGTCLVGFLDIGMLWLYCGPHYQNSKWSNILNRMFKISIVHEIFRRTANNRDSSAKKNTVLPIKSSCAAQSLLTCTVKVRFAAHVYVARHLLQKYSTTSAVKLRVKLPQITRCQRAAPNDALPSNIYYSTHAQQWTNISTKLRYYSSFYNGQSITHLDI